MTDTTANLIRAIERHSSMAYTPPLMGVHHETTEHGEKITINLDTHHAEVLTRILDTAPRDGNPLDAQAIPERHTNLGSKDIEKIYNYIRTHGKSITLEDVAEAFLYTKTKAPNMTIHIPAGTYVATCIEELQLYTALTGGRGHAKTRILADRTAWKCAYPVFYFDGINPENITGVEASTHDARAIRYYAPGDNAPLGGILMERTN